MMLRRTLFALIFLIAICAPRPARASAILDPTNDFLATYGGHPNGDLDVVAAEVLYDATNFYLQATMNGPIGFTNGGIYVLGFNRGAGTAGFASIGITGVLFDRVIVINNNDTSNTVGVTVSHSGNNLFAVIPRSLPAMAPNGFAQENFTWNLWPRDPLSAVGNAAISDFAPDNSNAAVDPIPEPSTLTLLGIGAARLAYFSRRRLGKNL